MRTGDHTFGAGILAIVLVIGGLDMLLETLSLVVRYEQGPIADLGWHIDAAVSLPILLTGLCFICGLPGRAGGGGAALFLGALALLFLVLQSPFDAIADHLFLAHQVQHMALCMVLPIMIVVAAPQPALLRGLPEVARRRVVRPLLRSRAFGRLRALAHPAAATPLYIATNALWMTPRLHDLALADERLHGLMHLTLLAAGLLFFWRLLDARPFPIGPSIGTRLAMFALAALGDILIGSFLAFKSTVLYPVYGPSPHLFGIPAIDDECYGGLTMWIPGAGMLAFAMLLTLRRFAAEEDRRAARPPAPPASAATRRTQARAANRRLASRLVVFSGGVAVLTCSIVVIYHLATMGALQR